MNQQKHQYSLFPYLHSSKARIIFLMLCCVMLNVNTIRNEYALDDEMVIGKNTYVHMGFSGVGNIFGKDTYQGFMDEMDAKNPLSGGRYRPLSVVSFAIEEQLFAEPLGVEYAKAKKKFQQLQATATTIKPVEEAAANVRELNQQIKAITEQLAPVRHAMQVVYYGLTIFVLFIFLDRYLLKEQKDLAFVATLLFAFHPVHTEVVANIKSRDEIFSLLFILLSCICVFRYIEAPKITNLVWLALSTTAALFSKEYAVVIPVVAAVAVSVTNKRVTLKQLLTSIWFLVISGISVLFLLLRYAIVSGNRKTSPITDVLNDPYMYATGVQKVATKVATLMEYVKLLIWPHLLSADYSYSHFPYLGFSDFKCWLSLVFWIVVLVITIKLWQKRHILSFALIFFLLFFMLINNMLFAIGATMGERLIFHSSLGFCLVVAWFIIKGTEKIVDMRLRSIVLASVLIVLLVPAGYKTIARNTDWRNNFTLFTRDVRYISNSALTNGNAGAEYYNRGYQQLLSKEKPTAQDTLEFLRSVDTAIFYLDRAIVIHPKYVTSYMNRGLCHLKKGQLDSAMRDWKIAAAYFNGRNPFLIEHARTLLNKGKEAGSKREFAKASEYLNAASIMDTRSAEIYNNLGGAEFMQGHFAEAQQAFNQALTINANLEDARQGALVADNYLVLQNKCRRDSLNADVWIEYARALQQSNFTALAQEAYAKAYRLNPDNSEAKANK